MTIYAFALLQKPGDSIPIPEGANRSSVSAAASAYGKRHNIRLRLIGDRVFRTEPHAQLDN